MYQLNHILLAVLCLFSCQGKGAKKEGLQVRKSFKTEQSGVPTTDTAKKVELMLVPNKFKANDPDKKGKFIVRNNTEEKLCRGSQYTVERWNGNKWIVLPFKGIAFPDMLYFLHAKEDMSFNLCLSRCLADGAKIKGKYRLTITISKLHEKPEYRPKQGRVSRVEDLFDVSGEFTVE